MKSIQTTALILWMVIFVAIAFAIGQLLASKEIFDITSVITGEKNNQKNDGQVDEFSNEAIINKIGQETVRIGLNVATEYFETYYKEYVNYLMANIDKYSETEKVSISGTLASDYVFYAVSRNIDDDKYKYNYDEETDEIVISEAQINSFADKMFGKEIDESFRKDGKYNYDKKTRKYSIEKDNEYTECTQELEKIENITSNQIALTYTCKRTDNYNNNLNNMETIKLTCIYKGGRYIVTEVEI